MSKHLLLFFLVIQMLFAQELSILTSYDKAIQKAKQENKRVLLFIYSDYCPWCDKMKVRTLSNKEVIKFISEDFIFVSINRESKAYPKEFTPRFIPTTYLIEPHTQEEVYALYGYKTATEFLYELHDE